jgi:hypothetical protein
MWILKGAVFGVLAFVVFALFFFFTKYPIRTNSAISLSTLRYLTVQNPWFWTALVLMVCTGCVCARLLSEVRN